MSSHMEKSVALADKITTRAEEALADLDCEMALRRWPADFRAIMWEAVAAVATSRADDAKRS